MPTNVLLGDYRLKNKMVTIKDVAREAGVSVSTASRALAGYGYVKSETRDKILNAAVRLNFHYNTLAQGLRTNKSYSIGYLLPDITNPFYSRIAKGIQDYAFHHGYNVIIFSDDNDETKTKSFFKMVTQYRIEGIIYSNPYNPKLKEMCKMALEKNIPVINCYGSKRVKYSDIVLSDPIEGCFLAMMHLLELGHRDIAIIKVKGSSISDQRFEGCKKALDTYQIELPPEYVIEIDDINERSGFMASSQFFLLERKPTAIFTITEPLAIGVIKAARDSNIKIPTQLSLVSVDDIISELLSPSLTSVSIPVYEAGKTAGYLLLSRIESEEKMLSRKIYLEEKLIIRESTGIPLLQ